jgi:arsenate reductase (thioredoxin)
MKFFGKSKDSGQTKQVALFICIENAGRSQMAEGFFKKYSPECFEPISAGTKAVAMCLLLSTI